MTKKTSIIARISKWLIGQAPQADEGTSATPTEVWREEFSPDTPPAESTEGVAEPAAVEGLPTTATTVASTTAEGIATMATPAVVEAMPAAAPIVTPDQIVDLRTAVAHAAATFHSARFFNTQELAVDALRLYVLPTATPDAYEACFELSHDADFLEQLHQEFAERLLRPTAQFAVQVEPLTTDVRAFAPKAKPLYPWLYVEVLRAVPSAKPVTRSRYHLQLTATQGELWSDDGRSITLRPEDCPCFVGRCREVLLKTGTTLTNKVAFVGVEEQPERADELDLCRYVSRSAIRIDYHADTQQFSIERSPYITSTNHVVHLHRADMALGKVALSPYSPGQRYMLCEGDTIVFNRKVGLSVHFTPATEV